MRREYIAFHDNNVPVSIQLVNIKEYPIHWHKAIEIFMVLKGSINVSIESDTYKLVENEIEIVNMDEAHRIFAEEDNLVLIMHIDVNFLEKYYDDIKNMYFYTDCSFEGEPQVDEKYFLLKKYIAIILCEIVQKGEDYDLHIKETLVELLYLMINDFHYLIYEKKELKNDIEQLQRYHRIVKYIYNNYNDKISLKDIAKKEYLSAHYLSSEIKNTMGINFKDFVNLTRVEESVKLLLDTDMTISDISEEIGFSHIRYYNKAFKKHYKMTPRQYRKKYKIDESELQKIKKTESMDLKGVLDYFTSYLEDYDRYNYKERMFKVDIRASEDKGSFVHRYKDTIYLPKAHKLLRQDVYNALKIVQGEIGFEYGRLAGIFSEEMGAFEEGILNLKKIKKIIDLMLSVELRPDIVFESNEELGKYTRWVYSFLEYFKEEYGSYEVSKWRYTIDQDQPEEVKSTLWGILKNIYDFDVKENHINSIDINPVYDTSYMIPYIIHQVAKGRVWPKVKIIDELVENGKTANGVFWGDSGLLNWEGLKKPSYYAYYFLSKLGDTLVDKGDGYIITSTGDDIQVLLYTHSDDMESLIDLLDIYKLRGSRNITERNISLNITNLWGSYRVTKYDIQEMNSCYNQWKALGSPKLLKDDEIELLKLSSIPRITLGFRKKMTVQHLNIKIKGYGAVLVLFKALK